MIPVNIRVTDANDNAPQFVNAPYVLNISEVRNKFDLGNARRFIIFFVYVYINIFYISLV